MSTTVQPTSAGAGAAPAEAPSAPQPILPTEQITWGPGPASMPPGSQSCTLYGDPARTGAFVMRVKVPKGYAIPAHSHANAELVTVLSGAYRVGAGERADAEQTTRLTAGGFFAFEPNSPHFSFVDEEAVLQVSGIGPWVTTYVNPADDPRQGLH